MRPRPFLAPLERALLAAGVVCLVWWAAGAAYARWASASESRCLDRLIAAGTPASAVSRAVAVGLGDPIGRVEIPRVGLSIVIVEGDDDLTLAFATGHIPGTALPGEAGNAALAGHRDGVFSGLARIRYIGAAPERFIVQARLVGSTTATPRAAWAPQPGAG